MIRLLTQWKRPAYWHGLWLAVALAGCERSPWNLAPVEGIVTLGGAPVADAGVLFMPTDPQQGPPAMGATDAEGKFTLMTVNHRGAAVGDHRVTITKSETIAIPQRRGFPIYQTKHLIPEKYSDLEKSGLAATVEEGTNWVEFELIP